MSKLIRNYKIFEEYREEKALPVDRENGVIRGVKILGKVSRNGRRYTEEAIAKARPLYEGAKVNIDHPKSDDRARSWNDGIGELRNVVVAEDGGLRGDLHYNREHALAGKLAEDAERFPRQFGLSHNADGQARKSGKETIVESIDKVFSVDVVGSPATNKSLYESAAEPYGRRKMKVTVRSLVESFEDASKKTILKKRLTEMAGDMAAVADTPVDAPDAADAASGGSEDQIDSAFKAMVVGVLDDDSLDVAAKLAKIKLILTSQDKLLNGTAPASDSAAADTTDTATTEGKAGDVGKLIEAAIARAIGPLQEQAETVRLERILESAGVTVTADRLKAMKAAADDKTRDELVEGWKPSDRNGGKPRPRTTGRKLEEGVADDAKAGAEDARRAFGLRPVKV